MKTKTKTKLLVGAAVILDMGLWIVFIAVVVVIWSNAPLWSQIHF